MPRKNKKAPVTPVRDAILYQLANPSLNDFWPLPTSYACSSCRTPSLKLGPCRRRNSRGFRLCTGLAVHVRLYRARCRCMNWTVTEKQLLSGCTACHRRIEAWDPDLLLTLLCHQNGIERGPVGETPTGPLTEAETNSAFRLLLYHGLVQNPGKDAGQDDPDSQESPDRPMTPVDRPLAG